MSVGGALSLQLPIRLEIDSSGFSNCGILGHNCIAVRPPLYLERQKFLVATNEGPERHKRCAFHTADCG